MLFKLPPSIEVEGVNERAYEQYAQVYKRVWALPLGGRLSRENFFLHLLSLAPGSSDGPFVCAHTKRILYFIINHLLLEVHSTLWFPTQLDNDDTFTSVVCIISKFLQGRMDSLLLLPNVLQYIDGTTKRNLSRRMIVCTGECLLVHNRGGLLWRCKGHLSLSLL